MSKLHTQRLITHVEVAVNIPLRQCFSYTFEGEAPKLGARVSVPFGRRKRLGIVLAYGTELPINIKLKGLESILDETPVFSSTLISLLKWTARYYHHPIGEVWRTAMPAVLRRGLAVDHGLSEKAYSLSDLPADWRLSLKRAPLQLKVIDYIKQSNRFVSHKDLINALPNARNALGALIKKNWVIQSQQPIKPEQILANKVVNTLTVEQASAFKTLSQEFDSFGIKLLEGVTGSGKTEVYFKLIDEAITRDKQSLVLLPEIALTDQHFARFTARFGSRVAQIHSGMNEATRYQVWSQARNGEIDIVLTTRSGVFIEFSHLGLIIVDEEHDLSYKQQEGLRYHARSIAIKRAQLDEIPVVLGSATPAFETLLNVKLGRYTRASLKSRIGDRSLPEILLLDLNTHQAQSGLSRLVIEAIEKTLQQKQQALVFINRRGYAPVLYCPSCQWTAQCKRCDAQMTTHQTNYALQCHHCGAHRALPQRCDACGTSGLIPLGEGTQKIEQTLLELFPAARIQRFDRDALSSAGQLKQAIDKVHAQEIDILVGTQLLSKGHDFSAVDLVVVINADQGLYSVDFRAPEQLVQQLIQVAGRAGRGKQRGRVLIQTQLPEHPALLSVKSHNYAHFAEQALTERKLAEFPPYTHIALWRARGRQANEVMQFLQEVARLGQSLQPADTFCFDPVKSPMFKRGGQYHAQLLMSARERRYLHQWLRVWIAGVEKLSVKPGMKWSIDIDPMSLF